MHRLEQVERLMEAFAERTGLVGASTPRRYLWTDAFAVCNYLSLYQARGARTFIESAGRLVDQVHEVLGAYAENDTRNGWLGGMDDGEHSRSPTRAGLRIGKAMPERGADEPFDERREWDRDGQYFHYLTRWMHALERMAEATGEARYHRWAVDLACAAFDGFVEGPTGAGPRRMFWKMSIDLDRPLVPAMGHHDPLDGWVTARMLIASDHATGSERRELIERAGVYRDMFAGRELATGDPLGIGGLLVDAWQLFRAMPAAEDVSPARIAKLVEAAVPGLDLMVGQRQFEAPPGRRLGFRELGLATGLRAADRLAANASSSNGTGPNRLRAALGEISDRVSLADDIERTWLAPDNRDEPAWTEHRDINEVMLATCLAPDGYLGPAPHTASNREISA